MIGIVILNYRNWQATKQCVESIVKHPPTEGYKIILIDNASGNKPKYDLIGFVEKYQILWIQNKKNVGFNAGNNIGIVKALEIGCDSILISNSDVRYFPHSIQALKDYLDRHPNTGIVGPKILDCNGAVQKSCLCRKTGMKEKYLVRTKANILFRKTTRSYFGLDRDYNCRFQTYAVLGCCFMMSKKCAETVSPFDEHPFLYEEELILGMQMEKAGLRTVYEPKAVVVHLHGASTRQREAFSFAHNVRSEIYYCRKYLHAAGWQIWPLYVYRVFLYALRCLWSADFRKNWKQFSRLTLEEIKQQAVYETE